MTDQPDCLHGAIDQQLALDWQRQLMRIEDTTAAARLLRRTIRLVLSWRLAKDVRAELERAMKETRWVEKEAKP